MHEERLVQQLSKLQQHIAPAGLQCQSMTQNQRVAAKQLQAQQLAYGQQGGDIKSMVSEGIDASEQHHNGSSYRGNLGFECQSQYPLVNVQPLKTGLQMEITMLRQ